MPAPQPFKISEVYIEPAHMSNPDQLQVIVDGVTRTLLLLDIGATLSKYSVLPALKDKNLLPELKAQLAEQNLTLSEQPV